MALAAEEDRFSTAPVEVDIGERGYAIPRNYLQNISYDKRHDHDLRAMMRALWPGLEPLTPENTHLWEHRDPERQIFIQLERKGREGNDGLKNAIKYGLVNPKPQSGPFGLIKFSKGTQRLFVSTDEEYKTPRNQPLMFRCNDADEQTKKHFDFEATCAIDYFLEDGAGLHYIFFMINLKHWREIDASVRALVDSYRN